jgi:hypothetical protein
MVSVPVPNASFKKNIKAQHSCLFSKLCYKTVQNCILKKVFANRGPTKKFLKQLFISLNRCAESMSNSWDCCDHVFLRPDFVEEI